jgi:peroxiredoxin
MEKRILLFLFLFISIRVSAQETSSSSAETVMPPQGRQRPMNEVNKIFPFDLQLVDKNGKITNTNVIMKKNGKPTVLAFWVTTCVPCRHELTAISSKIDAWKIQKDFNFYAISIDFPQRYHAFLTRVEESKWNFPAFYDLNLEFSWILPGNLNGLPQVFVFDKNGNIVHHTRRYAPGDEDALFQFIKEMD